MIPTSLLKIPYENEKTPARSAGVFSVETIRNPDEKNRDSSFYKWEGICYSMLRK